jgi:diguanylate cyclase (GGDEF)-like protein
LKKVILPGLGLYALFSGLGFFLFSGLASPFLLPWLSGYLVLIFTVSYQALFHKESPLGFEFLILTLIGLNFLVQISGGSVSPFHPAYFLIAAAAAFQPQRRSYLVVACILAVEAGNLIVSGQLLQGWQRYLGFAAALAGITVLFGPFTTRIKKQARMARERYQKLVADAKAVDPLDDQATVEALSEQNRQASNISTAMEREGTFKGLIDMIYEMVPAHTYALFLAERDEDRFILRAIRSRSSRVRTAGSVAIVTGSGLIGIGIGQKTAQYFPDMVVSARNLAYYNGDVPVKSFLAIPINQGERIAALLVVDSLEQNAFSPEDQDLLVRFAPFFSEIIEKIRMSQELQMRARNFAALHEMSATLSSSLDIGEVLETLSSQLKSVVPYDYCAFLHYDEKNSEAVITAVRGYDPQCVGSRFPPQQSAILLHMMHQWQERSLAKVHYDPDLGTRGRDISLFPVKEMQKQILSLYGRPLIARNRFIGAFFLGTAKANAFTEYHRNFMDTLLNQVAAVVDNSIMHQNIKDMARTDGLTGLLNHRTFMEKLFEEYKRIDRERRPFSILLMDIDKFKNVNDTYGHPVGDIAIKAVAKVLKETARATDFVARYGGEEFAVGMVDTTTKGAGQMAERVRSIMEKTVVTRIGARDLKITLSIGVSSFPEHTGTMQDLVQLADNALYQAKRSGRNRVCLHKDRGQAETVKA